MNGRHLRIGRRDLDAFGLIESWSKIFIQLTKVPSVGVDGRHLRRSPGHRGTDRERARGTFVEGATAYRKLVEIRRPTFDKLSKLSITNESWSKYVDQLSITNESWMKIFIQLSLVTESLSKAYRKLVESLTKAG